MEMVAYWDDNLFFLRAKDIKERAWNMDAKNLLTIPEWNNIPFLVHGFGDKTWKEHDLEEHPRLRDFTPLFLRQIHSDMLHIVHSIPEDVLSGDALVTDEPGMLLVIKTADCLPVLVVDPEKKVVAAVHCGWKSTSQSLVQKVVKSMEEHFRCDPSSLLAALGPCIGKDCYEVGEDVRKRFQERGLKENVFLPHPLHVGKYYLDLRLSNKQQLEEAGVLGSKIAKVDLCSHCEENLYSYRRSPQIAGRMLSFIGLSDPPA
jgi:YfiH family protein